MKLRGFHSNFKRPNLYRIIPIMLPITTTTKKGIKNLKFATIKSSKRAKNINLVKLAKKEINLQNIFSLFSNYITKGVDYAE